MRFRSWVSLISFLLLGLSTALASDWASVPRTHASEWLTSSSRTGLMLHLPSKTEVPVVWARIEDISSEHSQHLAITQTLRPGTPWIHSVTSTDQWEIYSWSPTQRLILLWLHTPAQTRDLIRPKLLEQLRSQSSIHSASLDSLKKALLKLIPTFDAILPSAHAEAHPSLATCSIPNGAVPFESNAISDFKGVTQTYEQADTFGMVMGCLGDFVEGSAQGAWDSTVGLVLGGGKLIGNAVTNPKATLEGIRTKWNTLTAVASEIAREWRAMGQTFLDLPGEMQQEILCPLAGQLTAGVVSGSLALSGIKRLQSWTTLTQNLQKLRPLFQSLRQSPEAMAGFPREFLSRLSLGRVTPRQLETIEDLAPHPSLAAGAARCAL